MHFSQSTKQTSLEINNKCGYCLEKAQVVGIVGIVGMVEMVGIVGIKKNKKTVRSSIWVNYLS